MSILLIQLVHMVPAAERKMLLEPVKVNGICNCDLVMLGIKD